MKSLSLQRHILFPCLTLAIGFGSVSCRKKKDDDNSNPPASNDVVQVSSLELGKEATVAGDIKKDEEGTPVLAQVFNFTNPSDKVLQVKAVSYVTDCAASATFQIQKDIESEPIGAVTLDPSTVTDGAPLQQSFEETTPAGSYVLLAAILSDAECIGKGYNFKFIMQ